MLKQGTSVTPDSALPTVCSGLNTVGISHLSNRASLAMRAGEMQSMDSEIMFAPVHLWPRCVAHGRLIRWACMQLEHSRAVICQTNIKQAWDRADHCVSDKSQTRSHGDSRPLVEVPASSFILLPTSSLPPSGCSGISRSAS